MRARAEHRALAREHAEVNYQQICGPAPCARTQQVFSCKAPGYERKKEVDEVQKTHWLQRSDANQARQAVDHHGHGLLKYAVHHHSESEACQQSIAASLSPLAEQPEKHERRDGSEPLVPRPAKKKVVAPRGQSLPPRRAGRLEDPAERHDSDERCASRTQQSL